MSEPRIIVIGEKFIDRYLIGTATRLSPEAPIPVVAVKEVIQSAGGAGNVTENLRALGAHVFEIHQNKPHPIKNRLIGNDQQLARWDENDHVDPIVLPFWPAFEADGLIISDYGKGGFTPWSIMALRKILPNIPYIFVDTKQGPDSFWFNKTQDIFFFPNMKEFRQDEQEYYNIKNVIRTESENGMTYINYGQAKWFQPALAKKVVSVCGAGDTAIAAFAYQYCKTQNIAEAMYFASKACAVVVAKPLTAVASHEEINKIT